MPDTSREHTSERLPLPGAAAHVVGESSPGGDELVLTDDNAQLFQALIQGATDFAIFKLTLDGHIAAWNSSAERLLGYRADEIIGRHFELFYTPEDRAAGMPAHELELVRGRGLAEDENWLVRKDGTRLWSGGQSTLLLDVAGRALGVAKICRDRTQHKEADEAVHRQAALLDQAHDAIIVQELDTTITFWNRGAEELYGWSCAEALGRRAAELLKTRFPTSLADVQAIVASTGHWEGELVDTCRDGREIVVASRWGLQRDAEGRPAAVLETIRDVTEQTRNERALRMLADASEQLGSTLDYEATLQTVARLLVPDLADYCLIDVLGEDDLMHRLGAAHVDPAKETLLGRARSYPPDLQVGTSPLAVALTTGQSELVAEVTPEWIVRSARSPDHRRLVEELGPCSVMLVPLVVRGQTLGLISIVAADSGRRYTPQDLGVAEDLARRCAAAIDNARLFRQAREAIRVRDEVLVSVSHDLKSPLTSISGTAQLLQRRVDAAGAQHDDRLATGLERIVATTARMSALIDDLMDAARLELGQDLPLRRQTTDLVALVEQAIADHQRGTERHQIELERRVDRVVGMWDPARLRRVLDNLLGNAVKYSPEGGPIRVTVDRIDAGDGPSALLMVADRGVGIPPEDRAHIFERGRRGHNVGAIAGAGIGLAGTCQIVRQHGGQIDVESEVGAGSTFTIRLPLNGEARGAG